MAVDLELIERLFADMRGKQAILEGYRQMPRVEFAADPGRILAVEHALQTMIQGLIDISLHLLAHSGAGTSKVTPTRSGPSARKKS
jgi:uncharacterized protein YutE (UPF0331/DUF86 family)